MINEGHLQLDTWDLKLSDDTPGRTLDAITWFGHIVILPVWTPPQTITVAQLLARSIYTAPLFTRSDNRTNLGGYGPAVWLGMRSGGFTGLEVASDQVVTDTLEDHIDTFVFGSAPSLNGITPGSIFSGGPGIKVQKRMFDDTPLDILEYLCAVAGLEWRIRPNLQLDVRAASTFWPSSSATIRSLWGGRDVGLPSYLATFQSVEDCDEWHNGVAVKASNGSGFSAVDILTDAYWSVDAERIIRYRNYGSEGSAETVTEAEEVVDGLVGAGVMRRTHQELKVELLDCFAPRLEIEPGCSVSAYAPELGIYNLATPVQSRGQVIHARSLRVMGMSWPVQRGMGVWFIDSTEDLNVIDLTSWVEWEDDPAVLHVGSVSRSLRQMAA